MRAPVFVSVQDKVEIWHRLPDDLPGIQYGTSVPGGCDEATIPVSSLPLLPDLQQGCRARITDGTTGRTLWTGRLSSPVRERRGVLQSGDPSFEGQVGYLGDRSVRYTPLVTRLDAWWPGSTMKPYAAGSTVEISTYPSNPQVSGLFLTMANGYRSPGDCVLASFHGFYDSPGGNYTANNIRGIVLQHNEGNVRAVNRSKFQVFLWHGQNPGGTSWQSNAVQSVTKVTHLFDPTAMADVTLGYQYNGAAVNTEVDNPAVQSKEFAAAFRQLQVFRYLRGLDGANLVSFNPLSAGGIWPHQIVTDLIGTFAFEIAIDADSTVIDNTSDVLITSYDFSAPASMADILTDLNTLVPTHYWFVGPCNLDGRMPLSWVPWSDTRIILLPTGTVTYDESAGADDLANWVTYTYTDTNGQEAIGQVQADPWTYPDIQLIQKDAFTQVEAPPLDLTSLASPSAAAQVAKAYLGEVATLPKSATATIDGPVVDSQSGAMIPPWELVAGVRAHVPETNENLRVTKVSVDVDSGTATLTLGTPRRTTDQIVSTLSKHRMRSTP